MMEMLYIPFYNEKVKAKYHTFLGNDIQIYLIEMLNFFNYTIVDMGSKLE